MEGCDSALEYAFILTFSLISVCIVSMLLFDSIYSYKRNKKDVE
jgi:hypothetical protein